ncbi:hypothetical protein TWF506_001870 [Arthrobotrys conoides]|uniref:Uncharacterized protein n=1 Tax=Arthrobotrys conoides TaxID=74498 RepID=A0AAN8PAG4_9PEZI
MASQTPSNTPMSAFFTRAFQAPPNAQDEEPTPAPINPPLPAGTQLQNLRARARIMSYQLDSPLRAPEAPHGSPCVSRNSIYSIATDSETSSRPHSVFASAFPHATNSNNEQTTVTDNDLANLRYNRLTLSETLAVYIEIFPGDTPEDLLTTFGVHVERNTIPEIYTLSNVLELLLKETEHIEKDLLGNDPLKLRNFKWEENSKMGREIRTLRTLIDSYIQIEEELRRKHGIIMAPIELSPYFEEFYGRDDDDDDEDDDEDYESADEFEEGEENGKVDDKDEDQESMENDHEEQSTEPSHDQDSLGSSQDSDPFEFPRELFHDKESSESDYGSEKSENVEVDKKPEAKNEVQTDTQEANVKPLLDSTDKTDLVEEAKDEPLLESTDKADSAEEAKDEPLFKSVDKTGTVEEEAPMQLIQQQKADPNCFKIYPYIVTLAIGVAVGGVVSFSYLLKKPDFFLELQFLSVAF